METLRELRKNHALGNPIRLGIMLYLLPREKALFRDLVKVLEITPGNLDSHIKTLQKEGYVEVRKIFADRPRTIICITEGGAVRTKEYISMLKKALEDGLRLS